jgi:hypothetical protein
MAMASARGCNLEGVSRGGRPEWVAADVGRACRGVPKFEFSALLYSLAGDDSVRLYLWRVLLGRLRADRDANRWTKWINRIDGQRVKFAEQLVDLFLVEERSPSKFQIAPHIRYAHLGIECDEWGRAVAHQYACIGYHYQRALMDGSDIVRRNLRGGDE